MPQPDELPAGSALDGGDRWFEVVRALLPKPDSPWWDARLTQAERATHRGGMHDSPSWKRRLGVTKTETRRG